MIKNRKMGHIGLAVNDIESSVRWYIDVLGFELIGSFTATDGAPVRFLKSGDIVYEIFQPPGGAAAPGKIDHFCFESTDIEADYAYCAAQGYTFEEEGIQSIPTFWEKGIRYFKIMSPTGEAVEFCQIL